MKSKNNIIKGGVIIPNASIHLRYKKRISKLIDKMARETEAEIKALFLTPTATEFFSNDASIASQARILLNALIKKFNLYFAQQAEPIVDDMISETDKSTSFNVKSGIEKLSEELTLGEFKPTGLLKETITASIAENVNLIKSIPQQYLNGVQSAVMRSVTSGNGLQDLMPFIRNHKMISERRAKIISLDQTRKVYANISKAKMQSAGIKKFEWIHSGGGNHPRKEHIEMSGKIYSFDNPPVIDKKTGERGFPAQAINCRCVMRIVVDFED